MMATIYSANTYIYSPILFYELIACHPPLYTMMARTYVNPFLVCAAPPSNVRITGSGLNSNTVRLGASTTLRCSASGTVPLQYQWKHNGTVLGVTSPTYRVSSAEFSDAGRYTCQVSNWVGSDRGTYALNVQGKYTYSFESPFNSFLHLLLSCSSSAVVNHVGQDHVSW